MAGNNTEPMGIPGRRGLGAGAVVLISALTAVIVSAATVFGLLRYGGSVLGPLAAGSGGELAPPAVVPDLVGLRLEAADELLTGRGLRLVVEARRAGDQPAGSVIEQRPLGHSRVESGAAVSVIVSEGADTVAVPELKGKTLEEARAVLEAVGLSVGPVSEGAAGAAGAVLSSVPEAGASLARDKPVALTIGPAKTVPVPRLIGLHRSVAKERIEKAGLEVGKVSEIYDRRRRGNLVLEQTPAPKEAATLGTKVDLIINQGD